MEDDENWSEIDLLEDGRYRILRIQDQLQPMIGD